MPKSIRVKIRDFLTEYFNDEELMNLCFYYFPPVSDDFTIGMRKSHKIRQLIEYCENRGTTENLLAAIASERPDLYRPKYVIRVKNHTFMLT